MRHIESLAKIPVIRLQLCLVLSLLAVFVRVTCMCFSLCVPMHRQFPVTGNCIGLCSSTHVDRKRYLVLQKYTIVFNSNILFFLKVIMEQLWP